MIIFNFLRNLISPRWKVDCMDWFTGTWEFFRSEKKARAWAETQKEQWIFIDLTDQWKERKLSKHFNPSLDFWMWQERIWDDSARRPSPPVFISSPRPVLEEGGFKSTVPAFATYMIDGYDWRKNGEIP